MENFFLTFLFCSVLAVLAFLYLLFFGRVTPKEVHVSANERAVSELDQL
jgi:hypothetical protein